MRFIICLGVESAAMLRRNVDVLIFTKIVRPFLVLFCLSRIRLIADVIELTIALDLNIHLCFDSSGTK